LVISFIKVTGRFVGNVLARLGWLSRFAISDDLEGGKELLDLNCYKSRLLLLYPNKQESLQVCLTTNIKARTRSFLRHSKVIHSLTQQG